MSRQQRQVKDSAPTQATPTAKMPESLTVASLVQELDKHKESLAAELKTFLTTSLDTSLTPIRTSLETINAALDSHNQMITTIENTLSTQSDEIAELTTRLDHLEKANAALTSKAEDLENRSRRQNIRIVGLPEGLEGGSPSEFISKLLRSLVGNDVFPTPPELDRAHRAPAPKPALGQRPRAIIARFHRYQDKERVLRWARLQKEGIKFDGNRILFFPDMSAGLAKQRATFKNIKAKLYAAGITFSLRHPARLCITANGETHLFNTPEAAETFYERIKGNFPANTVRERD